MQEFVYHPRGCRTASHQHDVVAHGSPAVPKVLKSRDKIRFGRFHPRHLIKKYHFLAFILYRLQHLLQAMESICPVFQRRSERQLRISLQGFCELRQLQFLIRIVHSHEGEGIFVLKEPPHKECLSDASPSVNHHKLRTARCQTFL